MYLKVLDILEGVTWFGLLLACVTLIKLILIGKNLNFMNVMFILVLMVEIVTGALIIPNFFIIGVVKKIGMNQNLLRTN